MSCDRLCRVCRGPYERPSHDAGKPNLGPGGGMCSEFGRETKGRRDTVPLESRVTTDLMRLDLLDRGLGEGARE